MLDKKKFGRMVKKYRKFRGYTLEQVADGVNIGSGDYVGKYESGNRTPSLETVVEMANFLGVSMDSLFRHSLTVYESVPESEDFVQKYESLTPNNKRNVMALMNEMLLTENEQASMIDRIDGEAPLHDTK